MASTALKKVQIGKEVTWGTGVAATAIVARLSDASMTYEQEIQIPEYLGSLGPGPDGLEVARAAAFSLTQMGTYEQLGYWLDGIFGTATATGTADPYTYTYAGATSTAPTPRIFTVEYGADTTCYELNGGIVTGLNISIDGWNPWEFSVDMIGESIAATTFTGALSEQTVNVLQGLTNVYIDALAGTVGTTAVTGTVRSASISFETGRHLKQYVDNVIPLGWGEGRHTFSLDMTAEFNATTTAYIASLLGGATSKIVRLKKTDSTRQAQLDFYGVLTVGELFGDADGNVTVDFTLAGRYDATNSKWFAAEIKHANATHA